MGSFGCVRLTDASAAGASPAERKGSHHFHREPCAGHREVSGEASVAACTAARTKLICGVNVGCQGPMPCLMARAELRKN